MTIYLDVVFLENISMNSIILYATGVVTKTKCKIWKILLSSLIGAIYVIGTYLSNSYIYLNLISKILLSISMVYIAFNPKNLKLLFKYVIIFYLTSFVFGGCAFFLLYYIKPQEILYKNGFLTGTYPIKIAFLGAMIGLVIISIAFKIIKNRLSKNDMFCDLKIKYKNKIVLVHAMIDTGNLLKDPITRMPVAVVQKNMLEKIIEKDVLDSLEDVINGTNEDLIEKIGEDYISRFRLIPFSSIRKAKRNVNRI